MESHDPEGLSHVGASVGLCLLEAEAIIYCSIYIIILQDNDEGVPI